MKDLILINLDLVRRNAVAREQGNDTPEALMAYLATCIRKYNPKLTSRTDLNLVRLFFARLGMILAANELQILSLKGQLKEKELSSLGEIPLN